MHDKHMRHIFSIPYFRMNRKRNLILLVFNQLLCCSGAFQSPQHSVRRVFECSSDVIIIQSKIELDKTNISCSESSHNGVEMKITVEKEYFEAKFPSRVKDFDQIDGFYEKIIYQDQMQIEFENENCK